MIISQNLVTIFIIMIIVSIEKGLYSIVVYCKRELRQSYR